MEIAASIAKKSRVKSFPDDYVRVETDETIDLPSGTNILMFRQDENVVVSIDSVRLYFRTYDEAKYIFYSAKRGNRKVPNPAKCHIQEPLKTFEEDLDHTEHMISGVSGDLDEGTVNMLRVECSRLLGYSDIF